MFSERYSLTLQRERMEGTGNGATLSNGALVVVLLIAACFGAQTPWWCLMACPAVNLFALWRYNKVAARIRAIDAAADALAKPKPAPVEKALN